MTNKGGLVSKYIMKYIYIYHLKIFLLKQSHGDFGVNCTLRLLKHFYHTLHSKMFLDL